jgi:hypothetical protein
MTNKTNSKILVLPVHATSIGFDDDRDLDVQVRQTLQQWRHVLRHRAVETHSYDVVVLQ